MAYNPMSYSPYGLQMPGLTSPQPQVINGLNFIDDESVLDSLRMPPGSVSPPYFLKDSNRFIVVTFDNVGGSTREHFTFDKEIIENPNDTVTKADLEAFKAEMMEAINGKHTVQQGESAANRSIADFEPDQAAGTV